jgi:hypothetical protein
MRLRPGVNAVHSAQPCEHPVHEDTERAQGRDQVEAGGEAARSYSSRPPSPEPRFTESSRPWPSALAAGTAVVKSAASKRAASHDAGIAHSPRDVSQVKTRTGRRATSKVLRGGLLSGTAMRAVAPPHHIPDHARTLAPIEGVGTGLRGAAANQGSVALNFRVARALKVSGIRKHRKTSPRWSGTRVPGAAYALIACGRLQSRGTSGIWSSHSEP